ncbi:MAG TPA: hypothetical protein VMT76_07640 [Puia sp.]|nr:hypothetical protein [Puia sp.]
MTGILHHISLPSFIDGFTSLVIHPYYNILLYSPGIIRKFGYNRITADQCLATLFPYLIQLSVIACKPCNGHKKTHLYENPDS